MTHLHDLCLRNAAAPTALDWVCSKETMKEILQALTPKQFVVAALLIDGMAITQIADELGITIQAVCFRRKMAQERIARSVPEVMGDVLSRRNGVVKASTKQDYRRNAGNCADCGRPIWAKASRCRGCASRENARRRREPTP